mgnify:CR=1 FL=1
MNQKIREYAQERKVKLWQIAEKLGLQDSNFSRKLRHELSEQETDAIMAIIDELAASYKGGGGDYD